MNGRFLDPLVVSPRPDGIYWFTCAPFRYRRDRDDPASVIEVPVGFLTDFASTPREIWSVFPPWGIYGPAAIVHDRLYWYQDVSRETADLIFLEAMTALGATVLSRIAGRPWRLSS